MGQSGLGMAYLYGRGVPVVRKLLHMTVIFKIMANLISNLQFLALERGRRYLNLSKVVRWLLSK